MKNFLTTTILAITFLLLVLIGVAVFLKVWSDSRQTVSDLAKNFVTGRITTTFIEDIPIITSTHGNRAGTGRHDHAA